MEIVAPRAKSAKARSPGIAILVDFSYQEQSGWSIPP
jgi:hypothetical protein